MIPMEKSQNIVLELQHVTHGFGKKNVLFDVNLSVKIGEFVGLVGPSGCGKSTLLRAIVGTHPAESGQVVVYGSPDREDPHVVYGPDRERGIVYQRYSLFPDKTALENVALGLMLDESAIWDRTLRWVPFRRPRRRRSLSWKALRKIHLTEAADLLKKFRLDGAMNHYPHELSGGMCQRVAIAQALIMKPKILLLDEPFGALDEATREEQRTMILELYAENLRAVKSGETPPYTVIMVTHGLNEAILVSDRVAGLSQYWNSADNKDPRAKGASTIVYDDVAPVFSPTKERDHSLFAAQREEIYRTVFDPKVLQERDDFIVFWEKIRQGKGKGVMESE